jgi:hypothetical protein
MSPDDRDLLHRHLNGDLQGAELDAFFARLKDSPELRRALASFATDEALLSEVVLQSRHRLPKRRSFRWVPAAAAAVLLAALVWLLQMPSTPPAPPAPAKKAKEERPADPRTAEAIGRGQAFLARRKTDLTRSIRDGKRHAEAPPRTYAELAALALPENDPLIPELVDAMLGKRIESTYTAALQAVALNRLDAAKHRERIAECYRFLAESQCLNGQWDYGEAPPQRRPNGDNSCSAYAALGLRACREAGIQVDPELLRSARDWWLRSQNADGGWGYNEHGNRTIEADPKGDTASNASYGSTTASGAYAVSVLSRLLRDEYATVAPVRRAVAWLHEHHALDRNPGKAAGFSHLHYWLALERLGESLGSNPWYAGGEEFLRSRQQSDGAWRIEQGSFMGREVGDVLDTCLAVIYLRRVPFSRVD